MTINSEGAMPPVFLRRIVLGLAGLTGFLGAVAFVPLSLTAVFGGEGESASTLALFTVALMAVVVHAAAVIRMLLHPGEHRLLRNIVFIGGIVLLAVSGAAVLGAGSDDSPGGVLAGLLLAAQGAAAVLSVAFPQLVSGRASRA